MWLQVEHRLQFAYDNWISESQLELRVEPRISAQQSLRSFWIAVGPPARVHRYLDWNGNVVHHFGIHDFHERIEVITRSLVETHPTPVALGELTAAPTPLAELGELQDFVHFGGPVRRSARLEALAPEIDAPGTAPLGVQAEAIGRLVHERFRYVSNVTDWSSTSDHLLETGAGVCQDFAHVSLALMRLRAIPCRYVSGYLHAERTHPAQSHAWVEVHAGARGWVGYDPTHARAPDERYVVVAVGRHYDDVPPNRGIYRGNANEKLRVEVHTTPAQPTDVAGLHEETASIDLPVFREIPLPRQRVRGEAPEALPEQQQ